MSFLLQSYGSNDIQILAHGYFKAGSDPVLSNPFGQVRSLIWSGWVRSKSLHRSPGFLLNVPEGISVQTGRIPLMATR